MRLKNTYSIGISAKQRCGKSTLAKMLINDLITTYENLNTETLSFGDRLKEEVSQIYEFPLEYCYSEENKLKEIDISCVKNKRLYPDVNKCIFTVRRLMQFYGQYVRETQHEDYWVNQLRDKIYLKINKNVKNIFIIDDMRYQNEYDFLSNEFEKSLFIRIEAYDEYISDINHPSEIYFDDKNYLFNNIYKPKFGINALVDVKNNFLSVIKNEFNLTNRYIEHIWRLGRGSNYLL
jgi:hypothetical protein